VAWLAVGWIAIVAFLAETLRLPSWAMNLSPMHLVGDLPMDDLALPATWFLLAFALLAAAAALSHIAHRELRPP
jgi:ABC-2 type transport system permease protein